MTAADNGVRQDGERWLRPIATGGQVTATGAVLFATLELPRVVLVGAAGSWQQDRHVEPRTRGVGLARAVSWLLGR